MVVSNGFGKQFPNSQPSSSFLTFCLKVAMAFSMAGLLKFLSDIGFLTVGNDEKEVAVEATPEFANIKFLFSAYPAPKRPTLFIKFLLFML